MSDSVTTTFTDESCMDLTDVQTSVEGPICLYDVPRHKENPYDATGRTVYFVDDGGSSSSSSSASSSSSIRKSNCHSSNSTNAVVHLISSSPQSSAERPYIIGDEFEAYRTEFSSDSGIDNGSSFSFNNVHILDGESCASDDDDDVLLVFNEVEGIFSGEGSSTNYPISIVNGIDCDIEEIVDELIEVVSEGMEDSLDADKVLSNDEIMITNREIESEQMENSTTRGDQNFSNEELSFEFIDSGNLIGTLGTITEIVEEASSPKEGSVNSGVAAVRECSFSTDSSTPKRPKEKGCEAVRHRSSRRCIGKPFKYVPGVTEVAADLYGINKNSKSWPELQVEGTVHFYFC